MVIDIPTSGDFIRRRMSRSRSTRSDFVWIETWTPGRQRTSRHFLVSHLAVDPDWQGQGIGARLLAQAETNARAAGLRVCTLHVALNNPNARRLYEKTGYRSAAVNRYPPTLSDRFGPGSERMVKLL